MTIPDKECTKEEVRKAGANERSFREKVGKVNIGSKIIFGSTLPEGTNISVDGHFIFRDKLYLVEIDSANEAKLLAGQYCLVNALYNESNRMDITALFDKANVVFLVIHYYPDYNVMRTTKNLQTMKSTFGLKIGYLALHSKDIGDWDSLTKTLSGI